MAVDYKIEFKDVNDDFWRVWIRDTTGEGNSTQSLKAATGSPLVIRTVNNDEDPFAPVRGKEVSIYYLNEDGSKGIGLFVNNSPDDRWKVEVERVSGGTTTTVFVGALMLDDMTEEMRPPVTTVKLVATDKLGSLKDVLVRDWDGSKFNGVRTVVKWLAMALSGTELQLPISIADNAKCVISGTDYNLLEKACLDSRSFEDNNGVSDSCYKVLTEILGNRLFVMQSGGRWLIAGVDEYAASDTLSVRKYSYDGVYDTPGTISIKRDIGVAENVKFVGMVPTYKLRRAAKSERVEYAYDTPDMVLKNQNYTKGSLVGLESVTPPPPGYNATSYDMDNITSYANWAKYRYNINGWTFKRFNPNNGNISTANTDAYIRRYFFEGKEWLREIAIYPPPIADRGVYFLQNDAIVPIDAGDRVLFGFEFRVTNLVGGLNTTTKVAQILLKGDSGTVYALKDNEWTETDASNPTGFWTSKIVADPIRKKEKGIKNWLIVKNDWSDTVDGGGKYSDQVPENGTLTVRLFYYATDYSDNGGSERVAQNIFRSINLEIVRYNGANILQAKGQYAEVEQGGNYAKLEKQEVKIDSSPKRLFRGALLYDNGSGKEYSYNLITQVKWSSSVYNTYSALAAIVNWNQYYRVNSLIYAELMLSAADDTDLDKLFVIEDGDKRYMLLGYEYNVRAARMTNAMMVEVYDSNAGKRYSDTVTIDYLDE